MGTDLLYELMNLTKPFKGKDRKELFKNILNENPQYGIEWEDLILEMMATKCMEKSGRISAKSIAKHEKSRLQLAVLELRIKENLKTSSIILKWKNFSKINSKTRKEQIATRST